MQRQGGNIRSLQMEEIQIISPLNEEVYHAAKEMTELEVIKVLQYFFNTGNKKIELTRGQKEMADNRGILLQQAHANLVEIIHHHEPRKAQALSQVLAAGIITRGNGCEFAMMMVAFQIDTTQALLDGRWSDEEIRELGMILEYDAKDFHIAEEAGKVAPIPLSWDRALTTPSQSTKARCINVSQGLEAKHFVRLGYHALTKGWFTIEKHPRGKGFSKYQQFMVSDEDNPLKDPVPTNPRELRINFGGIQGAAWGVVKRLPVHPKVKKKSVSPVGED